MFAARALFIATLLGSTAALAQSSELLQAVRLRRAQARAMAVQEFEDCQRQGPPCARTRELALLAGYLTLSEGNASEALTYLTTVSAPAALRGLHAFYLGQAYFYVGRWLDAARQFEASLVTAPRWLEPRLRGRLGEALLKAQQPSRALPHLEKVTAGSGVPELYHARAAARAATGDKAGERQDLIVLATRHPAHRDGMEAYARLRPGGKGAGGLSLDERVLRIRNLEDAGNTNLAWEETRQLEKEKGLSLPDQARIGLLAIQLLFGLGKDDDAQARIDRMMKSTPPSVAVDAALLRARKLMKAKNNEEARTWMAKVAETYAKEPASEEALFFSGWLALQLGKYPEGIAAFDAYDKRFPRSRRRDDTLWFKALCQARTNDYAQAKDTAEALIRTYPRSQMVPQAQYWANRWMQQSGGPKDRAIKGYEFVMKQWPGSFYALLSTERLRELGQTPPPLFDVKPKLESGTPLEELRLASTLAGVGLYRDFADEVAQRVSQVRNGDQALRMGAALQAMGEFGAAHALGARFLWGQAYTSKDPSALNLLYPRAFAEVLIPAAQEQKIDPFFMWAIMRRESGFRTDIQSRADARGLMQLIPPTGAAVAKALSLPDFDPADLYLPELNIKLSAWYLAALEKRFAHWLLVAAAYNAGPPAAHKWLEEEGSLPLDLFVEEIPFKETRAYVKQVIADQFIYRSLYAPDQPAPRLNLKLPQANTAGVDF